jgi:hypothetical protein
MRRYLLLAVAALTLGSMALVACGDDDNNSATSGTPGVAQTTATSAASTQSRTGSMLVALQISDTAGFHGMDEELNKAGGGAITARWLGAVQHAHIAVASVEWPEELKTTAVSFQDAAKRLADAIARDDAAAAAKPAKDAHDTQHDLSRDGWMYVAKQANVSLTAAGSGGHGTATTTATAAR